MVNTSRKSLLALAIAVALLVAVSLASSDSASASHSWNGYHWARTANPFTLKLGDNVSTKWDAHLATASADWSVSDVLDTAVVAGLGGNSCKAQTGRIEVCSKKYGAVGWLGIAQVWVSGLHITKATAKMNDTYFNTPAYNTPAWRQLVMCQEIAHGFGLDHQDEIFTNANLGTCMDYTNDPDGPPSNEHPNQHDYDALDLIYAHLDTTTTVASPTGSSRFGLDGDDDGGNWGRAVGRDGNGRDNKFERDFGNGQKLITHVFWVDGTGPK